MQLAELTKYSSSELEIAAKAQKARLSFFYFVQEFWECIVNDKAQWNWHIPYLCGQLTKMAYGVSQKQAKEYDMLVNIPPGTTKSLLFTVFFPAWCWTRWPWMRFIKTSFSASLSLEHAEACRDLVKSQKYQEWYPGIRIKRDKDIKSNFRIIYYDKKADVWSIGGNLYSTSVGGTVTGFHAHVLLVDDPIDPFKAYSEVEMDSANRFLSQVLPTRKVHKEVTPTIMIMQRVMEGDPSDKMLEKQKLGKSIKHICLPGKLESGSDIKRVKPQELLEYYQDGYLDPVRLSEKALQELKLDLGQYGYAGQIQQDSTIPGGGMFKIDMFKVIQYEKINWDARLIKVVRFWDKAATEDDGAFTVGVKMAQLINNRYVVMDVVRGQWSTERREAVIKHTSLSDGPMVLQKGEQEPGSGGKDSAKNTEKMLSRVGISFKSERAVGDKIYRADPWSVRVNNGQVLLIEGPWNQEYINEHRKFGKIAKYKDQVDASSGAYSELFNINRAGTWGRKRK